MTRLQTPKKQTVAAPLSRSAIQQAALSIVDRDGLAGLTIRKLASALGVTPMAIYRHFRNKTSIEMTLVDLVIAESRVTEHEAADLRSWLLHTFLEMRNALCQHPEIMPLLGAASHSSLLAFATMENVISRVVQHGTSVDNAVKLLYHCVALILGSVILMDHRKSDSQESGSDVMQCAKDAVFQTVSTREFPNIAVASPTLTQYYMGQHLETLLSEVINSILIGSIKTY